MARVKKVFPILSFSLIIFCFIFQGCSLLEKIFDKERVEERQIFGNTYQNTTKVKELQKYLNEIGYKVGAIDGSIGDSTRESVREFQLNCALKESGYVDKKSWEKLKEVYKYNFLSFEKINTKKIQTALKNAGSNPGTIDGKLGSKTVNAIIEFQKENNLLQDGTISQKTWDILKEYLWRGEIGICKECRSE